MGSWALWGVNLVGQWGVEPGQLLGPASPGLVLEPHLSALRGPEGSMILQLGRRETGAERGQMTMASMPGLELALPIRRQLKDAFSRGPSSPEENCWEGQKCSCL